MLLETALGVGLILGVALPFTSLIGYSVAAARDLTVAQSSVRAAATSERPSAADPGVSFTCGASAGAVDGPCAAVLTRGSYVAATKDTTVSLVFGLSLQTNARAVARVE